jgi:hypothetical protein
MEKMRKMQDQLREEDEKMIKEISQILDQVYSTGDVHSIDNIDTHIFGRYDGISKTFGKVIERDLQLSGE